MFVAIAGHQVGALHRSIGPLRDALLKPEIALITSTHSAATDEEIDYASCTYRSQHTFLLHLTPIAIAVLVIIAHAHNSLLTSAVMSLQSQIMPSL